MKSPITPPPLPRATAVCQPLHHRRQPTIPPSQASASVFVVVSNILTTNHCCRHYSKTIFFLESNCIRLDNEHKKEGFRRSQINESGFRQNLPLPYLPGCSSLASVAPLEAILFDIDGT